jgi:hypothetical protein
MSALKLIHGSSVPAKAGAQYSVAGAPNEPGFQISSGNWRMADRNLADRRPARQLKSHTNYAILQAID